MKTKHLLILSIALLFSACNSKSPSPYEALSQPITYDNAERSVPIAPQAIMTPRKIAMSASINIDVDNIDDAQKKLNGLIQDLTSSQIKFRN